VLPITATDATYYGLLLALCFGEQSIVSESRTPSLYPHITQEGDSDLFDPETSFIIAVDRIDVTSTHDLVHALTICFLQYWLFDITYPKVFQGLLSFLDNFVFHKNSVRASQRVVNFINKL
jgi:hypothetical protein